MLLLVTDEIPAGTSPLLDAVDVLLSQRHDCDPGKRGSSFFLLTTLLYRCYLFPATANLSMAAACQWQPELGIFCRVRRELFLLPCLPDEVVLRAFVRCWYHL